MKDISPETEAWWHLVDGQRAKWGSFRVYQATTAQERLEITASSCLELFLHLSLPRRRLFLSDCLLPLGGAEAVPAIAQRLPVGERRDLIVALVKTLGTDARAALVRELAAEVVKERGSQ
jgi:hypothetical protein